ncbi:MAG: hypothetical protein RQ757_11435 [Pseudomonadales bacterium]|nr:hypothetical protein [Pseudomonadales bacterium]
MTANTDGEGKQSGSNFWKYFWGTIVLMVGLNLIFIFWASLPINDGEAQSGIELPVNNQNGTNSPVYEIQTPVLRGIISDALDKAAESVKNDDGLIGVGVDNLYAPVYGAIGAYTDRHYSVMGSYEELWAAVSQRLAEEMEAQLFAGFDVRLNSLVEELDAEFNAEFEDNVNEGIDQELPEGMNRDNLASITEAIVQDTIDRMYYSAPVSGFLSVSGAMGTKIIVQQLTAKLAAALTVKTGAKVATKAGASVLGGAATGAAAGAVLGPVGSAIGGAAAAIAVWFGVDKLFVEGDEFLNRESFEAELVAMIDESKEETKARLLAAIDDKAEAMENFTFRDLGNQ